MVALDVTSLVPASVWNEVGPHLQPHWHLCSFQLVPRCSTLWAEIQLRSFERTAGWGSNSHKATPLMFLALLLLPQGPTPGALQEMLDSIDKHAEQVGMHVQMAAAWACLCQRLVLLPTAMLCWMHSGNDTACCCLHLLPDVAVLFNCHRSALTCFTT